MTLVHGPDELPAALDEAFRYDSKVLVEAYLSNARELECGVLGNDQPIVFEPGEVRSHREWYDYEAKYTEGLADVIPRAEVEPELAARVKELALRRLSRGRLRRAWPGSTSSCRAEGGLHLGDEHAARLHGHQHVSRSRPSWPAWPSRI